MTEPLDRYKVFATSLALLGATFNRQVSRELTEGYWLALQGLDETSLKRAVARALQESKFMPAPSELLAFAGKARNVEAECAKAWTVVRRSIDRYDYTVATIDFGPRVNAVIANLGGWDTLCKASLGELDNPGWLRKRFDEIYQAYADLPPDSLRGEPLRGALPEGWQGGGAHVVVAIDGQPQSKRIQGPDAAPNGVGALIQSLADGKSL